MADDNQGSRTFLAIVLGGIVLALVIAAFFMYGHKGDTDVKVEQPMTEQPAETPAPPAEPPAAPPAPRRPRPRRAAPEASGRRNLLPRPAPAPEEAPAEEAAAAQEKRRRDTSRRSLPAIVTQGRLYFCPPASLPLSHASFI